MLERIDVRLSIEELEALCTMTGRPQAHEPQGIARKVVSKLYNARGQLESKINGGTHRLSAGQCREIVDKGAAIRA